MPVPYPIRLIWANGLRLVEMCVGVICSCMPAFSFMLRHYAHSFDKLKSRLVMRYHSVRHLLSSPSEHELAPANSGFADGCLIPCSSLESSEKDKKASKPPTPLHSRFGHLDTLRTFIRGGDKSEIETETSNERIRVTQDIEQGWQRQSTVTEESTRDLIAK